MNNYQENLKNKMNDHVHFIYRLTRNFPKSELYGVTSQLRRSTLSVVLNYIEGYARRRLPTRLNFLEISFASLKESKYLLEFSLEEKYIIQDDFNFAMGKAEEISAMLWTEINNLDNKINKIKEQ